MEYIRIYPENVGELEEMWEEFKYALGYLANRPKAREGVKNLRPDDALGSPFDFICKLCLQMEINIEDATHPLQESFFPKEEARRSGVEGLICQHCHDSGF